MYNRRESQNDAEKERNTAKRIKKTNSLIELTLDILNAPFASAVNELSS